MRPTLTSTPDPKDATQEDAAASRPGADAPPPGGSEQDHGAPGVREAVGGVRAALMRLIDAHITLLRAELGIAGRELGIIVGLAVAAFVLAVFVAMLLYVGSFLFMGEWLFGSMGWGIIHGSMLTVAIIIAIALELAGGDVRAYAMGALVGLVVAVLATALLLSNVGNEAAEWGARLTQDYVEPDDLPMGSEWLPTLVGLVVGAIAGAIAALVVVWRVGRDAVPPLALLAVGVVSGGFIGAIYASTRYEAPDGVVGLAIMLGLLTWLIVGTWLAARKGFDTEERYARLVPRESIAAFEQSRDFILEQWQRQKGRMMRR